MCKLFEESLNKDIKLLIGILEIRELAILVDRAKKVEELNNERKQAKREARASSKRSSDRTHVTPLTRTRDWDRVRGITGQIYKHPTKIRAIKFHFNFETFINMHMFPYLGLRGPKQTLERFRD